MPDTAPLPTIGVLSIVDGRLMGDIGHVYTVISFFIGRPAFTHELLKYGRLAEPLLAELLPDFAGRGAEDWEAVRNDILARHGEVVDVPAELAGRLADGVGPITNLVDLIGGNHD